MKRFGLFLLAVVMVAGMAGCGGSGDDFSPSLSNMAGVYTVTKMTNTEGGVTTNLVPPSLSGTITLTSTGTYTLVVAFQGKGEPLKIEGTYAIVDSTIVLVESNTSGPITDDGRKFSVTGTKGDLTVTLEFSRS